MPRVTSPGLKFPGIGSAGNAVTLGDDGATGDTASAALTPVGVGGSGVAWVGFLIHGVDSLGYAIITFNDGFGPTAPQLGVLYASLGRLGIDNAVVPTERDLTQVQTFSRVVWVIAKLDFDAGEEFLFVNPSNTSEPAENEARARLPMRPEFQASGFDRIVLKEGNASRTKVFKVDEVRVGTTFADLTP